MCIRDRVSFPSGPQFVRVPTLLIGVLGGTDSYGEAEIGGTGVDFSHEAYIATGLSEFSADTDEIAREKLTWMMGGTMLHEILHNHGFDHPKISDYAWKSDYASSLPHIAKYAVLMTSPHAVFFANMYQSIIDNGMNLGGRRVPGE